MGSDREPAQLWALTAGRPKPNNSNRAQTFSVRMRSGAALACHRLATPHWYYILRHPLGLDATVSGSQSMRFRNDTKLPGPHQGARLGIVRFAIWRASPTTGRVSWSTPSVSHVVAGCDTVQNASWLPRGKREPIDWPVDGMDVRRPDGPQRRWDGHPPRRVRLPLPSDGRHHPPGYQIAEQVPLTLRVG